MMTRWTLRPRPQPQWIRSPVCAPLSGRQRAKESAAAKAMGASSRHGRLPPTTLNHGRAMLGHGIDLPRIGMRYTLLHATIVLQVVSITAGTQREGLPISGIRGLPKIKDWCREDQMSRSGLTRCPWKNGQMGGRLMQQGGHRRLQAAGLERGKRGPTPSPDGLQAQKMMTATTECPPAARPWRVAQPLKLRQGRRRTAGSDHSSL